MIPNSSLIVSPTEPQGRNRKKVWFRKGKQLFNKDNANILLGFSSVDPKTFIANNSVKSIVINCSSKTTYTVSKIKSARFNVASYDKEIAPGVASTNIVENNNETKLTITTGDKDKYLCVYYYNSANDTLTEAEIRNSIQIEAGTIATPYEAYVENKMFVKNSNDVYEEFIKKEDIKKISFTKNDANNIYYYSMYATENEVQINADVRYSFSNGTYLKAFTIEKQYSPLIFSESEGQLKFPATTDYQAVGYAVINSNGEVYIHTNGQSKAAIINIRYRYR